MPDNDVLPPETEAMIAAAADELFQQESRNCRTKLVVFALSLMGRTYKLGFNKGFGAAMAAKAGGN